MNELLSIGDFSRMTFLSVKALRHYHDVGLLEPARVDGATGYRYYRLDQVSTAQLIRRLRALELPVDGVRAVLSAPDDEQRNRVIVAHLDAMSAQLRATEERVDSLRRLLSGPEERAVHYRDEPATTALLISESVPADQWVPWWMEAFGELHASLASSGLTRSGPDGCLFATSLFTDMIGEMVAFVPVRAASYDGPGRVRLGEVPAARLAVTRYDGPMIDLDQAYSAVGRWVFEQARAADGPMREQYHPRGDTGDILDHVTDVSWPVV